MTQDISTEALKKDIKAKLDLIYINNKNITNDCKNQWIDNLYEKLNNEYATNIAIMEQFDNYLKNLSGFNASEMAVMCLQEQDQYVPFNTANNIILQKQLKNLPTEATCQMEITNQFKPLIKEKVKNHFLTSNCNYFRDEEAIQKIKNWSLYNNSNYKWLKGVPDDILNINGMTILINYKISPNIHIDDYQTTSYHAFQLLHYKEIAKLAGIKVDIILQANLLVDNQNKFVLHIDDVFNYKNGGIDKEQQAQMLQTFYKVGEKNWQLVQDNINPATVLNKTKNYKNLVEFKQAFPKIESKIQTYSKIYTVINESINYLTQVKDKLKDNIYDVVNSFPSYFLTEEAKQQINLDGIKISGEIQLDKNKIARAYADADEMFEKCYKKTYDNDKLIDLCKKLISENIDKKEAQQALEQCQQPSKILDMDLLKNLILAKEASNENFDINSLTSLSKTRITQNNILKKTIENNLQQNLKDVIQQVSINKLNIDNTKIPNLLVNNKTNNNLISKIK